MTLDKKIIGGYAIVLALLTTAIAAGFYAIKTTQRTYQDIITVHERQINRANELRFETRDQLAHIRGFFLFPDERSAYLESLGEDEKQATALIEEIRTSVSTEEGRRIMDDIAQSQAGFRQAQKKAVALVQQGKETEGLRALRSEARPRADELISLSDRYKELQSKLATAGYDEATATANRLSYIMTAVSLLAVLCGIGIALRLTRTIARQMREGINQISSSTAEIMTTTAQVTSSATETASAISETSATAEEVKQTAQLSSQKAKYVSDTAQKASHITLTGKKAVEESLQVMNRIRNQMESIAEGVVSLSEKSQAIGEITATVNDLAEQSNLLAVNAAIEATRAGEQGKGFAVVAQEIKTLSEQSKKATAQVRAILNDIQKGVSTAVIVTEQGTKAVEAGVKQSAEAGETILALADSVAEAAQAANQIAASSQQQLAGMDQITLAMDNINQATTQNITGIKQTEQAVQNLNELAQSFRSMIESRK